MNKFLNSCIDKNQFIWKDLIKKEFDCCYENDDKLVYINLNTNMIKSKKINPESKELWYLTQWWKRNPWNKRLWFSFPILDLGGRMGGTGYLDFIRPFEDMISPVMVGLDAYCRPFISIVLVGFDEVDGQTYHAQTFFQRYTDGSLWQSGRSYLKIPEFKGELLETGGGTQDYQIKFLNDLLHNYTTENKETDVENYKSSNYEKDVRLYWGCKNLKKVRIMSQQEFDLLKNANLNC